MTEHSVFTTAVNIFASPAEAFTAIRERPRAIVPLVLIIAGTVTVSLVYMNLIDLGWFLEQQTRTAMEARGASDAEINQALENVSNISPAFIGAASAISSAIAVTLLYFVNALYLKIVSAVTRDGVMLKQWFGLVCWCALPNLLGFLASLVNLLTNDATFMRQEQINPLSFGSIFGLEAASRFETVLQSYDLTSIWALVLVVLGYQALTKRSLVGAALIVLAPYILVFGIGSYIAFS